MSLLPPGLIGPSLARDHARLSAKKLCREGRCLIYANGKALYKDDDHLSRAGTEFVLSEFEPIFADHGLPAASADTTST